MTLMLQLASLATAGFGIARGGPKRQFATGWQASGLAPQSASDVQLRCGLMPVQEHVPMLTPVQQGWGVIGPVHPLLQLVAVKHVAPTVGPVAQGPAFTHSLNVALDALVQSSPPQVPPPVVGATLGQL